MNKKIMSLLTVLLLFVLVACRSTNSKQTSVLSEPVATSAPIEDTFVIELIFGNERVTETIVFNEEETTLFNVIDVVFDITYDESNFGPMITSIKTKDGDFTLESQDGAFIAIYINDEQALTGVHEIIVAKDQTYSFVFEWYDQSKQISFIIDQFIDHHLTNYIHDDSIDMNIVVLLAHLGLLDDYLTLNDVLEYFIELDTNNVSELYKAMVIISAFNGDMTNVHGLNLVEKLISINDTSKYSAPYALIGLNTGVHDEDISNYESALIESMTTTNKPSKDVGLDMSGITLAALSPYKNDEAVKAVIDEYIAFLEDTINEFGGIRDEHWDMNENASSIAQVIIGLIAVDVNESSDLLTRDNSLITRLLDYANVDGSFNWTLDDDRADLAFSTPQAVLALTLYQKYSETNEPVIFYKFSE